jgi:hypothetical protein
MALKNKLGRLPRAFSPRIMHLSSLLAASNVPPPPEVVDWTKGVEQWGMMLNDTLGDCLTGDVVVGSGETHKAYRGIYDGPIAILTTKSGKKLTVTPNHAVLTERGFARAHTVQKGDNLIGTSRPEIFPGAPVLSGKTDFNQSPAPIKEIFSAFSLGRNSIRKVMPIAVDFHGDERFLNGNVDIVGADGFLRRQFYAALRQPYAKDQIGSTRKLQRRLKSLRAAFLGGIRRLPSAFGDIGFGGYGPAFGYAHAGVAQAHGLPHVPQGMSRPRYGHFYAPTANAGFLRQILNGFSRDIPFDQESEVPVSTPRRRLVGLSDGFDLYASREQPSAERHFTDAGLVSKLTEAFPGLVAPDSVVNVDFQRFNGHVYDVSTTSRMYSANGILAHNCTCAAAYHARQVWTLNAGTEDTQPDPEVLQLYEQACGYNPADPSTDQGGVEQDILTFLLNKGYPLADGATDKIQAFFEVDPRNATDIKTVINECGVCYIGFNVPENIDEAPGSTWQLDQTAQIEGGHAVVLVGYDADTVTLISWGAIYKMTWAFFQYYTDEAYAIIDPTWVASGNTPLGLSPAQLTAMMASIKEAA